MNRPSDRFYDSNPWRIRIRNAFRLFLAGLRDELRATVHVCAPAGSSIVTPWPSRAPSSAEPKGER